MTVSTRAYTATLPDGRTVRVAGGELSLDAGAAPHVAASVELPLPGRWSTTPDELGPWRELRRNLFGNPAATSTSGFASSSGQATVALAPTGDAVRYTIATAAAVGLSFSAALTAGATYRMRVRARANREVEVNQRIGNNEFGLPRATLTTDWQWVGVVAAASTTGTGGTGFVLRGKTHAPGDWVEVDRVQIEDAATSGELFTGDTLAPSRSVTPDAVTEYRYRWTGTRNASPSVLEARDVVVHGVPVWTPEPDGLELLDPRRSPAPRVVVTADSDGVLRRFDLGVRGRHVNVEAGTVAVKLASDEELLHDYAPLTDDAGAYIHQRSLRSVVEYVLRTALGAQLELTPAHDADVTRYSDSVNLCANPVAAVNVEGWGAAGVSSVARQANVTWAANSSRTAFRLHGNAGTDNSYMQWLWDGASGMAGRRMLFRARCRNGSNLGAPGVNAARMRVYYSLNGGHAFTELGDAGGHTANNAQADLWVEGAIPSQATHVLLRLYHGFKSADSVFWSDVQAREYAGDPTDVDYWDGSTPTSSAYRYTWQGAVGASTSSREALLDRPTDALLWQAGTSALEFLQPLVQANGLRLVCDELRRWTLRDESHQAVGELRLRQGVNIVTADETVSRAADSWFDARVTRYRWTDVQGQQQQRVDAYALPGYSRLSVVDLDAPYPGPGRSEYAVRRAQTAGSEVAASSVADWSAQAEQRVALTLTHSPAALVGTTQAVRFTLDDDRMTITTRVRELPRGAVDMLTGTINKLPGTINEL